jgi:hypothetical protein
VVDLGAEAVVDTDAKAEADVGAEAWADVADFDFAFRPDANFKDLTPSLVSFQTESATTPAMTAPTKPTPMTTTISRPWRRWAATSRWRRLNSFV